MFVTVVFVSSFHRNVATTWWRKVKDNTGQEYYVFLGMYSVRHGVSKQRFVA